MFKLLTRLECFQIFIVLFKFIKLLFIQLCCYRQLIVVISGLLINIVLIAVDRKL